MVIIGNAFHLPLYALPATYQPNDKKSISVALKVYLLICPKQTSHALSPGRSSPHSELVKLVKNLALMSIRQKWTSPFRPSSCRTSRPRSTLPLECRLHLISADCASNLVAASAPRLPPVAGTITAHRSADGRSSQDSATDDGRNGAVNGRSTRRPVVAARPRRTCGPLGPTALTNRQTDGPRGPDGLF